MTIRELIEELQQLDPKRQVILAKDAEGNGHSPLSSFWTGNYRAHTTWRGYVGLDVLTEEDRRNGYTEADLLEGEPAIILTPVS